MMSRATIVKEEILEENMRLLAIYIETQNAVLVLLSEGEDRLGTLAASVPSATEIQVQPVTSSILLGNRNTTLARVLAERLAFKTGKIGLVSIHLRTVSETEAHHTLIRLFEKVTKGSQVSKTPKEESLAS